MPVLDLVAIRRELHRIPELAFEEYKTSEMLSGIIAGLVHGRDDVEVTRERTAIIVHVPATAAPGGGTAALAGGETIGWRADMDGLPVAEQTGLQYASAHPGVMHACGHDVHMTCGLGILEQILSKSQRNSFVFFFQPAEENISGAQQICDAGLQSATTPGSPPGSPTTSAADPAQRSKTHPSPWLPRTTATS